MKKYIKIKEKGDFVMMDFILTILTFAVGMGCVAWFSDLCLKDAAKDDTKKKK